MKMTDLRFSVVSSCFKSTGVVKGMHSLIGRFIICKIRLWPRAKPWLQSWGHKWSLSMAPFPSQLRDQAMIAVSSKILTKVRACSHSMGAGGSQQFGNQHIADYWSQSSGSQTLVIAQTQPPPPGSCQWQLTVCYVCYFMTTSVLVCNVVFTSVLCNHLTAVVVIGVSSFLETDSLQLESSQTDLFCDSWFNEGAFIATRFTAALWT